MRGKRGDMTETVSGASKAKPSGGLKIERVFSTEGVHPYDELTWERRDVVQTNWKTGETVFEQRGAEFPDFWSVNASTIVTTKYFRGAVGTDSREWSLKQLVDRVVKTYTKAGADHGYFASPADAETFEHELTWLLVHQYFSFNSPVWFNVGTPSVQQVSACFILSVDDSMDSILNWYKEEGFIFKGGSGAGLNLSRIRSSKELLSSGGTASGPVSFMRGADASAGTIKSGGATRRAAKMVVLDVDHPDIVEFVETKAREEDKIRALRDAGFDMDLGGKDITSVQYQNANNSVRVTDEFMRAVEDDTSFGLKARGTGEVIETVDARELFRKISQAAWECADPGLQYDDTINDWHTNPETGRITASNPCCFTGETLVQTRKGPVPFELVVKAVTAGEEIEVPSLVLDGQHRVLAWQTVSRAWTAGETTSLVDVRTANGLVLRSTPEHRYLADGDWVEAKELRVGQRLVSERGDDHVEAVEPVELDEAVKVYDLEVPGGHNFVVTAEGLPGVVVHNSEYMSLDNSSCNLASLNLLKFLKDDDTFDAPLFAKAVELIITAMDISICFADFPTESIRDTTRDYRQLGIGYANLGALLMAMGLGYDSEGGRSMAATITSLMTGQSYKRSAELAAIVGPYAGYARNAEAHKRVMRKHQAANDAVRTMHMADAQVAKLATQAWADVQKLGEKNGFRNAQASVLAPTGCLTPDTLITTDRGLVRLGELGDVWGDRWQDLDAKVSTDEGPRLATKFFVNGEEPTRRIVTRGGYAIRGTLAHRIKVVDTGSGAWIWKRMADIASGDLVPMQLGTMIGEPRTVPLPVLDQAYYSSDRRIQVPDLVSPELAELVGYFMGDGSLHSDSIRFCVADTDIDVVERLRILSKELFHHEPAVRTRQGYQEVALQSIRLSRWWKAAGFSKLLPREGHSGKGWTPRVPSALLETNDRSVYAAFLRGLFEADGTLSKGVPCMSTSSASFASEVRTLLLTLGVATTTVASESGRGSEISMIRVRNVDHALTFDRAIGFMGSRKSAAIAHERSRQTGRSDLVFLPLALWSDLAPHGSPHWNAVRQQLVKRGGVSRQTAQAIHAETHDPRLAFALGYLFEEVTANDDGGVQPTYDISVPENVTYVASGFVSHNTIGFMMDCDTTGIEPDFSLVKFKKLVGGGSMQIVNQTIPRALRKLGYQAEQIEAIVGYISEHGHVIDAPGLKNEHYEIFDCAMGARALRPMGHVRMMAAAQPFLSGAISKTVNLPEEATVEEIEDIYLQSWKLGLKATAVYRDNCKVGQPMSSGKGENKGTDSNKSAEVVETKTVEKIVYAPTRKRLPKSRTSRTTSFTVGGAEGYMTSGAHDDGQLGEVFLKLGKQGSTLAGVMDAFSIAVSIGLQYGVPLETYVSKFTNLRFEPAGLTDDPDVRMAQSIMDYIFRRLALDYLTFEDRSAIGIYSAEERQRHLETGSYEPAEVSEAESLKASPEVEESPLGARLETEEGPIEAVVVEEKQVHTSAELMEKITGTAVDSPLCFTCGTKMRPAGSCYVCEGCGSTSGCS